MIPEFAYRGRKVVVTGGLGFLGSNLALELCRRGAEVTVVDAQVEGCGSNPFNIEEAGAAIRQVRGGIEDEEVAAETLPGQEVIFNLAGEISHIHSVHYPERDLDLNARAQLRFVEYAKRLAPRARIVYASSRQVYGPPDYLPVDERHPVRPVDVNGVHKLAAEFYHRLASTLAGQQTVCLRLTNTYGPRQALNLPWQGFIGTFFARLLSGSPLTVYGDGRQLRDMLYVDDAVRAFLAAGCAPLPTDTPHTTLNVGGPEPLELLRIAEILAGAGGLQPAGGPPVRLVPFPPERRKIDIGSYTADDRRFRAWSNWRPEIHFADGAARTLDFYRQHARHYPTSDSADRPEAGPPRVPGRLA